MSIEHEIQLLGRKGAFEVLQSLSSGKKRFTVLYERFRNPATLTRRLRELEEKGLVERIPSIVLGKSAIIYYKLTDKGKSVLEIFNRLIRTMKE